MKIRDFLVLALTTAALTACGSDNTLSGGTPLTSTGSVLNNDSSNTATDAGKATVTFKASFPRQAGVQKSAFNPNTTKVTVTAQGVCGQGTIELTPTQTAGSLTLLPGTCSFTAVAYDASDTQIDMASSNGTLLPGGNSVSLTFLGGPWIFVDPATNEKLPITLSNTTVIAGIDVKPGTSQLRWLGPDTADDGPTEDDLLGGAAVQNPPFLEAVGSFVGGLGSDKNALAITGTSSNLATWEASSYGAGDKIIEILGATPWNAGKVFSPTNYADNFTTKVIDGTTIEGNIAELTVDSINVTPLASCDPAAAQASKAVAMTNIFSSVRKSALVGSVTAEWTECLATGGQLKTTTFSNVNVYPFRARSYFADPIGELQIKFNAGMTAYKEALSSEDLVKGTNLPLLRQATGNLVAAADLANANQDVSPTGDAARFFGAISRLASLGVDTASDGVANGLNTFGDVLDAIGVPAESTTRDWSDLIEPPQTCVDYTSPFPYTDCTPNLPATSPTSGEIKTLLDTKLNTQLDLAIADLNNIPAGFSYNFTDPQTLAVTNFDYGDVLALTAAAHGVKAEMAIAMAYDLNLDIDATFNDNGPASVQQFLLDNPTLGTLDASRYAAELTQAKTDLQTALNKMNEAINVIEAEGTGITQENEFVSFYRLDWQCVPNGTSCTWIEVDNSVQEIANFRDGISKALTGLNGQVTVDDNDTPTITTDDTIIDPSKFFAGINFRGLLPGFTGDNANSLFPDPSMGGVLVQTPENINQDFDGNGAADLLEEPNFYAAMLNGRTFSFDWSTWLKNNYSVSWSALKFNSDGTISADWNYWDSSVYPGTSQSGTATGTWSILSAPDNGQLSILFTSGAPLNVTSINVELDDHVDVNVTPLNFGTELIFNFSDAPPSYNYTRWSPLGSVAVIIQ